MECKVDVVQQGEQGRVELSCLSALWVHNGLVSCGLVLLLLFDQSNAEHKRTGQGGLYFET